jgi:predicted nucleic acid-binding protein
MIGANDLMVAARASGLVVVVVTNNTKDFGRIKALEVENGMS